jgi:ribosomal protein S18 acetylase RimI-like enzyme
MGEIAIEVDDSITPSEIMDLQKACGSTAWSLGDETMWQDCIKQSLCIVTARNERKLVGVGFLVGNARHAELVDIVVDPEARGDRVGTRITEALIADAEKRGVRYLNLVRDPNQPWLKSYYESLGFAEINFAMEFPALQGD